MIQLVTHISLLAEKQGGAEARHRLFETNRIESHSGPNVPFMKLMAEEYGHNSGWILTYEGWARQCIDTGSDIQNNVHLS